jgi:chemotaxis protein methyltransferase CheR
VTFNRLNLIKPPYPISGKFDGILCRNVMIYFDQATRDALAERLIDHLHVGGVFVTGQAESVGGRHKRLKSIRPSVYRRVS